MPNPSRDTKLSGVNGDREIQNFPVHQLTTSSGLATLLTRLIHINYSWYNIIPGIIMGMHAYNIIYKYIPVHNIQQLLQQYGVTEEVTFIGRVQRRVAIFRREDFGH